MNYTNQNETAALAELLFPNVTDTPADMEAKYPPRDLPEGAKVTRFAPSPTGFVHFGGMFPVTVGERLAHQSGGVFYLRIEDTDAKREVPGAAEGLINTLARYGINFDEGAILDESGKVCDHGAYGPYKQSERGPIYHVYAKELVKAGRAYPVFTTKEELESMNAVDKKTEIKSKEWSADASAERQAAQEKARAITLDEVKENLEAGNPFVLRIIGDGNPEKKTPFTDLVRGKLELPENDEDFVLLKSDGIPTYHFAHAVDDHLMGTTHVIRGEEWLPSLPKHLQLFRELGFKLPKYLHISQLMKLDENGAKKKLSKRDMGANMDDYERLGYAPACVMEYVMTLLNSNYEEWHRASPDAPYTDFPFNVKKMCVSGCLFDTAKLSDVSKNVLSRLTADEMYELLTTWTVIYDKEFHALLSRDPDYAKAILAIGRGGKKPRKDFAVYTDVRPYMAFFYDELFAYEEGVREQILASFSADDVKAAVNAFTASYDPADDMNVWFEKVKAIAESIGFASDMKAYKADPSAFKGSVADISMFLRVALTGKQNAPDLYAVMQILGVERSKARLAAFADSI
ncbi:MAG: glutamate--tRNA ligase [Clostridia bacterium]|nr:glutamate--tRNA ligase [Clostridia bacterium]MBR2908501.1 glutamate--tRNA ligase [Clostridia bacterium]